MATSQIPFRMGDVVTYVGNNSSWAGEHIISEAEFAGSSSRIKYSTSQGAWIPHEDFALVSPASPASLEKLYDVLVEESAEW